MDHVGTDGDAPVLEAGAECPGLGDHRVGWRGKACVRGQAEKQGDWQGEWQGKWQGEWQDDRKAGHGVALDGADVFPPIFGSVPALIRLRFSEWRR